MPPTVDYGPGMSMIEGLMVDSCTITRDSMGVDDDTLNMTTGLLTRPVPDSATQYTGKCLFKRPSQNNPIEIAEQLQDQPDYKVLVPLSTVAIRIRDIVKCTASANDSYLVNRVFRVVDVDGGTHSVYRAFYVRDITTGQVGE